VLLILLFLYCLLLLLFLILLHVYSFPTRRSSDLAYLVDIIVLFSISGIFTSLLSLSGAYSNYSLLGLITAKAIVTGIIYYSYFLLMTKLTNQTLGKMIFNLKVVSETNEKLTWLDLFFREIIGRFIYNSIFIMKVLYLVVAFTPKKQGIHDMIGKTKVIHND